MAEKEKLQVTYEFLETELIDFSIENIGVISSEKQSVIDIRLGINGGISENDNFIEFTINSKTFIGDEICSITMFSRFRTITNINLIDNVKSPEIVELISRLGFIANSHLMGMFRVKSYGTNFSDYCIPIREIHEISELIKSGQI